MDGFVRGRRASVLIVCLWALFLLGALTLAVGAHVSAGLRMAHALSQQVRAYYLAQGAIAWSVEAIRANTNAWDGCSPTAWNNSTALFGTNACLETGAFAVECAVPLSPERSVRLAGVIGAERKLHLNKMPVATLEALLHDVGRLDAVRAKRLAAVLQGWRSGGEQELTQRKEDGYYPVVSGSGAAHTGPFASVQELLLVPGFDGDLFARVEQYVTVIGNGKVNVNVASETVMQVVAMSRGIDAISARRVAQEISQARPRKSLDDFQAVLSERSRAPFSAMRNLVTVRSTVFEGTALGIIHDSRTRRQAREGDEAPRSRIDFAVDADGTVRYWHEY